MTRISKILKWSFALTGSFFIVIVLLFGYLTVSESGLQWIGKTTRAFIPGTLNWQSLKGQLLDGPQIAQFHYKNSHVDVKIAKLNIKWNLLAIFANRIEITKLRVDEISVGILTEQNDSQQADFKGIEDFSFIPKIPITLSVSDAQVRGLLISNPVEDIFFTDFISLDASWSGERIHVQQAVVGAENYTVHSSGDLSLEKTTDSNFDLHWKFIMPEYPPLAGHTQLLGNLERLNIEHVQTQPGKATLNGNVSKLLIAPELDIKLKWDDLVLQTIDPTYPDNYIGGNLNIKTDLKKFLFDGELSTDFVELPEDRLKITGLGTFFKTQIELESFDLDVVGIASHVDGQGNWRFSDKSFDLALDWKALQWPLASPGEYESNVGTAHIIGQFDNYNLTSEAEFSGKIVPRGNIKLNAIGSLNGLEVEDLQIGTLDGNIEAQGNVTWLPEITWHADLTGDNINPKELLADYPGQLNTKLTSTGQIIDSRPQVSAQIHQLDGQLRDIPITAQSEIYFVDNELQVAELQIYSNGTNLNMSGVMSKTWDLQWSLKSAELTQLNQKMTGSLNANGTLAGNIDSPIFAGHLEADSLVLNAVKIQKTIIDWKTTLNEELPFQLSLISQSIKSNEAELTQLNFNGSGKARSHKLSLNGVGNELNVDIKIDGGVSNNVWLGNLQGVEFSGPQTGKWELKEPIKLRLGKTDIEISPGCLNSTNAHLCFELVGNNSTGWDSKLSVEHLPLSMARFILPKNLTLDGLLEASMESKISPTGQFNGKASIILPPGNYTIGQTKKRKQYAYQGGKLEAIMNNDGLKGNGKIVLQNDNGVSANWELTQFRFSKSIKDQPVNLQVKAKLDDFSFIEATSLSALQLAGNWQTDFALNGTIGAPVFDGHSQLQNGSVDLPDKGILLEQINISIDGSQRDKLLLDGSARSNKGAIELQGYVNLKPLKDWHAKLSIKGQDFEIIDTPETHVFISPDLGVDIAHQKVNIEGSLTIPEAAIKPGNLESAITTSDDVLILDPNKEQSKSEIWNVDSEIRLLLGDKVWFDGFGLKAWLEGDLKLSDKTGEVATGRGELSISEGTFRVLGRPLKIDRGRLIFRGGPIDDPGLDVATSRRIEAENVDVSVTIGGTLAEPTFKTSSEPPMAQTDILSYLLYGKKSDDNASVSSELLIQAAASAGLGSTDLKDSLQDKLKLTEFSISGSNKEDMAMTLGSYLSPSLFVGYTFGLFEAESQFQLNYRLSKKWYLEMETSTEASGGDVFYSFER